MKRKGDKPKRAVRLGSGKRERLVVRVITNDFVRCTAVRTAGFTSFAGINKHARVHIPQRCVWTWAVNGKVFARYFDDVVLVLRVAHGAILSQQGDFSMASIVASPCGLRRFSKILFGFCLVYEQFVVLIP